MIGPQMWISLAPLFSTTPYNEECPYDEHTYDHLEISMIGIYMAIPEFENQRNKDLLLLQSIWNLYPLRYDFLRLPN